MLVEVSVHANLKNGMQSIFLMLAYKTWYLINTSETQETQNHIVKLQQTCVCMIQTDTGEEDGSRQTCQRLSPEPTASQSSSTVYTHPSTLQRPGGCSCMDRDTTPAQTW